MTSIRQESIHGDGDDLDRRVRLEVANAFGRVFQRPIVWTDATSLDREPTRT
jgi:hypothetical protein